MKKKVTPILLIMLFSICYTKTCFSQSDSTGSVKQKPFSFQATYTGEWVNNFSGGIKKGATYLGLANMKLGFDPQKAGLWKNGYLYLNAGNTHGGQPSANLVGDFQGVSNIEAGNLTFLYELWYKQSIQNLTFILGLQDLNATFAYSEFAGTFVNSSFGIQPSIADNIPAPIFPLTALGFTFQWNITPEYLWQSSVFDGTPDNFESNPYNTDWKLSKNDGMTLISELQAAKSLIKGMKGTYKMGVFYHEHHKAQAEIMKNYGFYLIADQQIFKKSDDTGGLSLFSQIGLSPRFNNHNNHFYSLGAIYKGLFNKRPADEAGLAFAYAGLNENVVSNETAIELNYQLKISDHLFIKPDLQYILHPAGTDTKLKNALVGICRFGINF